MKLNFIYITLFTLLSVSIFSQADKDNKELIIQAETKLKLENYEDALEDYLQLVAAEPKNELYNYNTAFCYLNKNIFLFFIMILIYSFVFLFYHIFRNYNHPFLFFQINRL